MEWQSNLAIYEHSLQGMSHRSELAHDTTMEWKGDSWKDKLEEVCWLSFPDAFNGLEATVDGKSG